MKKTKRIFAFQQTWRERDVIFIRFGKASMEEVVKNAISGVVNGMITGDLMPKSCDPNWNEK